MPKINFSDRFDKDLKKLVKDDKKIKVQTYKTVTLLSENPKHQSLRLHKLSGKNYWSVSVNKSIRIITRWNEDTFYFLRIGTHEEIYR